MKHKLNYVTRWGGYVCYCTRCFDNQNQLDEHIRNTQDKRGKE